MEDTKKKEIVEFLLKKGVLITAELSEKILSGEFDKEEILGMVQDTDESLMVVNKENLQLMRRKNTETDWKELEKSKAFAEKKGASEPYKKFVSYIEEENKKQETAQSEKKDDKYPLDVLFSYEEQSKKWEVRNFVEYFNNRYKAIETILNQRQELANLLSINRLASKKERETVSVIGMIKDKQINRKGNIMLEIEDPTGIIKAHIHKNKQELFDEAKDLVLDEIVGIVGTSGDGIIFVNNVIWPEVPMTKEFKRAPEPGYAIFLSDIHVGSTNFLEAEFNKFIAWLRGETGSEEQKKLSSQVRYVFIAGDLIDGAGIYPGQEEELTIKDVKEQYDACAEYLKRIPSNIKIVICPGNHDAMRLAEPQPPLYPDISSAIWDIPNVIMVSNPAIVNMHSSEGFSGFDVLIYHGYSFDYYCATVDGIRNQGGYDRADLIMKFMLKRRHLAPAHTSTLYVPDTEQDPLVIKKIPDFFISGHIHKSYVANYRGVTMICGSCWQAKTKFQEKVGHHPEPCRVPIVNLQTRDAKILKFGD